MGYATSMPFCVTTLSNSARNRRHESDAAAAPPTRVMNSRRLIRSPRRGNATQWGADQLVKYHLGAALKVVICPITGFQSACSVRIYASNSAGDIGLI